MPLPKEAEGKPEFEFEIEGEDQGKPVENEVAHISLSERMYKLGYSLEQIQNQLGKPPHTLGIGVYKAGERTKMRPAHCAMFRAEKDALKRRFDILWSISIDGQVIPIGENGDEEELEVEHVEAEYAVVEERDRGTA